MVDTERLRTAIRMFSSAAKPTNRVLNRPCTAEELEKAINEVAKLMTAFVEELEQE